MSRKTRYWKPRLQDIKDAIFKIQNYCKDVKNLAEFSEDAKTYDACVRNFQVIGEASKKIPQEVKKELPGIPWKEMGDMRNILVHEYFGTSASIIWSTIQGDLPELEKELNSAILKYNKTAHDWKICPVGEYFVRGSSVDAYVTQSGKTVRDHLRREHCREYSKNRNVNILSLSEIKAINNLFLAKEFGKIKLKDFGFGKKGADYDSRIAGWVDYWNEVLKPPVPLDANFMKALFASESSFNPNANKSHKGKKDVGLGIGQIMPTTTKALMGYKKELKDHFIDIDIDIDGQEVFDPDVNIVASIRWIFQKRKLASVKLKREATWIEAVETYKNVLNRKKESKVYQENMQPFLKILKKSEEEK